MSEPPRISVVIPTYRRPEMLAELLDVLGRQLDADPAAEAVVVDNCPDRSAEAVVAAVPALRYVHEALPGVAHARNTGVASTGGDYVLFLDDDEVPQPGWLAAFRAHAERGADMAFGRLRPVFEAPPDPGLAPLLTRLFSRDYDLPDGADLSAVHVELGTGNALFRRATCLSADIPFDPAFNRSGGEDIYLIQRLAAEGRALRWCPGGLALERVPATRMTEAYLRERRFNQGRLRCLFLYRRDGLKAAPRLLLWMGVGAAQIVLHGARAAGAALAGDPSVARERAELRGGLGKLFWWRGARADLYGG